MPEKTRRIALLVETSLASGRDILQGIARYAHQSDCWQLYHAARGLHDRVPDWMRNWNGDGVIARIQDEEIAAALRGLRIPVVDVLGVVEPMPFPLVHVDDAAIARMAAEHLRQRGFRHFAFFGITGENWSERRRDAFKKACRPCASFSVLETERGGEHRDLRPWLRGLPQPVGLMVASDQRGLVLLEACRELQLPVPERLAVVGVDDDAALCEISAPPLSSVRAGHRQVGFEAARLLDRLMAGGRPPGRALLVPPSGLTPRRSSALRAVQDELVARGLSYMHDHLSQGVSNASVAHAAGVSRTLFQRRFREEVGTGIRSHLTRLRLERAQSLIATSDLSLAEIAAATGFRHPEYMGFVFRKELGVTPASLRAPEKRGPTP